MEKLGEHEFRRILKGIELLTADLGYETFPGRALAAVAAVIQVDFISYNEVDAVTGAHRFLLRPDPADLAPGSFEYAAFIRRFGNHPVVAQKVAQAETTNPELRSLVNRLRFLGMVGNCCGQAELRLNMGMTVSSANSRRVGLAIHRSLRDFDDRDASALEALRPHIAAAYRNALHHDAALNRSSASTTGKANELTKRENEVLYWVSMGKTNGEVGEIIGAKAVTVKKHLEHIYDKLGVPNRTAASRLIARTANK